MIKLVKKLINFPQIFQLTAEGLPSFRNWLAGFFQPGLSSTRGEGWSLLTEAGDVKFGWLALRVQCSAVY